MYYIKLFGLVGVTLLLELHRWAMNENMALTPKSGSMTNNHNFDISRRRCHPPTYW